jgi:hypothetical protein
MDLPTKTNATLSATKLKSNTEVLVTPTNNQPKICHVDAVLISLLFNPWEDKCSEIDVLLLATELSLWL